MLAAWLESLLIKSAVEVEVAGKSIFQFSNSIRKTLQTKPIQEWEAALWARGLKTRLLRQEGYFFRAGTGKNSSLSFFVRNEQGRYVGLRRESITQAATYVTLVTDYGYARTHTRFETGWMDVAVFDNHGDALIYAENKASEKTLQKLCTRLKEEFNSSLPPREEAGQEGERMKDDAVMKAWHLWRHKPRYFWGVSPTGKTPYEITYHREGFELQPIAALPSSF